MTAFALICTGRYKELFAEFYDSFRIVYGTESLFVLTDDLAYFSNAQAVALKIEHGQWPAMVMQKYRNLLRFSELWRKYDKIVCLQSNMIFRGRLPDFDSDLLFCYHPYNGDKRDYICGGLVGGKVDAFLRMGEAVQRWLDNHPNARWHDETAINWYWRTFGPDTKILPSSAMYAEERSDMATTDSYVMLRDKSRIFGSADKLAWT